MTGAARGWSDHASGDKVSEAIIGCVERRELGDRATPIRHDHFFAGLDAIDVLAETILEVADPDLRPRSSYLHAISVATSTRLSRGHFWILVAAQSRSKPTHIDAALPTLEQRISSPPIGRSPRRTHEIITDQNAPARDALPAKSVAFPVDSAPNNRLSAPASG